MFVFQVRRAMGLNVVGDEDNSPCPTPPPNSTLQLSTPSAGRPISPVYDQTQSSHPMFASPQGESMFSSYPRVGEMDSTTSSAFLPITVHQPSLQTFQTDSTTLMCPMDSDIPKAPISPTQCYPELRRVMEGETMSPDDTAHESPDDTANDVPDFFSTLQRKETVKYSDDPETEMMSSSVLGCSTPCMTSIPHWDSSCGAEMTVGVVSVPVDGRSSRYCPSGDEHVEKDVPRVTKGGTRSKRRLFTVESLLAPDHDM